MEFAVGVMADAAQHLVRIHHLRDRLRRHKRPDLDGTQACADQCLDEIRSATLTGIFSFCRPSRGPTSTMRTESLMLISRNCRLDLGELDAFLHDIADLAFYHLQHAPKRCPQGLF